MNAFYLLLLNVITHYCFIFHNIQKPVIIKKIDVSIKKRKSNTIILVLATLPNTWRSNTRFNVFEGILLSPVENCYVPLLQAGYI